MSNGEERVRLLVGSPGASTTPIYSPGSSSTPIYYPGSSTPPHYSLGASTPQSYSPGTSRNAECSNCKDLLDKITILEATLICIQQIRNKHTAQCVEAAEAMGTERDHLASVVSFAVNIRSPCDIMTLTVVAATALCGAATLKKRIVKDTRYIPAAVPRTDKGTHTTGTTTCSNGNFSDEFVPEESVVGVCSRELPAREMDLFNLIKASNPTKVKIGTRQRTAHEVPLLTATTSRVSKWWMRLSSPHLRGHPPPVERSPLDFSNEDAPTINTGATEATVEPNLEKEVISMGPTIRKRRRQRDAGEEGSKAPAKVLRKDHDAARAEHSARGGKLLAEMSVDTELAIHAQETQEPPVATQIVNDTYPLSYAKPRSQQDVTQSSKEKGVAGNQDSERSTPSPPITGSPGSIYQPGWGVPNSCRLDTPEACQDVASGYGLLAEVEIRAGGETFEDICGLGLEVGNAQLSQQVSVLQAQVMGEKRIMAAFEEFKKHEDERVNARCKEIDARLDALSIDFDEELYPHMLTAIAGRRWVIGHGLRLAVMKCAESTKLRQAFANVVSTRIAKGMSEGLKYGVEHGKAGLELTAVEAYDPEADNKYVAVLHNLKDLNYPL
ncbi:gypsy type transposase, partial [Tanacetum coccineum]